MEASGASRSSWPGRWFDGRTPDARTVEVRLGPDALLVDTGGDFVRWPFAELVLMRGDRAGEPVQIERRAQPVEVVIVDSPEFLRQLRASMPRGTRLRGDGDGAPTGRILAGISLAALTLLFVLWRFGIPALADFAAERMPPEWEAQFGAAMLRDIEGRDRPVTEAEIRRPVMLVRAALVPEAAAETTRRVVVLMNTTPNAFAIPGGHIVLTTGLLKSLRSPDELAAVYAHEWGHVSRRHVLRSVLRQASLQILLALIAGDQSAVSSGLRTAGELGSLSYSRGYEREADDEAMALLASHGASPDALGDALESIRKAAGVDEGRLGFLSTHPAPKERIARIREEGGRLPIRGQALWRDMAAWKAMKQSLGEMP